MRFLGYLMMKEIEVKALKDELKHEKLTNKRLRTELNSSRQYLSILKELLDEKVKQADDRGAGESNQASNSESGDV